MEKYRKLLTGLMAGALITLALVAGCATDEPSQPGVTPPVINEPVVSEPIVTDVRNILSQEADEVIRENRENPGFVILDVRTDREYIAGHIEGAINIDVTLPSFYGEVDALDRNATYLVYCRTGNRSRTALAVLQYLEFKTIYHLVYGIEEWTREGFPVVKP